MKKIFALTVFLFLLMSLSAQNAKSFEGFLADAGIKPASVMLVGTFHFSYPNLDQHKTEKKNMRDILSAKSQAELQQVLEVLRAYHPTRIYLESDDQHWLDSCYNACTDSTFRTQRNERVQIGFRLAKELKLAKVYGVDANAVITDLNNADSNLLTKVAGSDSIPDKEHAVLLSRTYSRFYRYGDSITANATLLKAFIFMNDPRNLQLSHGDYLSGYFNTLSNYGPDVLSIWWINRNLRIFNNILLTKPSPDDRILVLFGSGHIPLLKQCFESSPDFKVIDFYSAALRKAGRK